MCRPKGLGGLGILDLEKFARALRLRWLWFEWVASDKPWVGLETPNDKTDRDLFNAATSVTIGDGMVARFWSSSWLNGISPKALASKVFEASKKKNRSVQNALDNLNWVADISVQQFTTQHISQFITLWDSLQGITLTPGTTDTILWTLTTSGCYTASSAYKAQFQGSTHCSFKSLVWKTWVIRVKRIYNFLVIHANFVMLSHVPIIISHHFYAFCWTNLLTRCPVPVPYFCCFCISENHFWKYSRNWTKIYGDIL